MGRLCLGCSEALPKVDGRLPEHSVSRSKPGQGWLLDSWGRVHALNERRTSIGRRNTADFMLLHSSVSRAHAEISCRNDDWEVRDLGSRNHVYVAGSQITGPTKLVSGVTVAFGDLCFYFCTGSLGSGDGSGLSVETGHAGGSGPFRYVMSRDGMDVCLLGPAQFDVRTREGGALLLRRSAKEPWTEVSLSPLDFQLLRTLCARALEEADSPAQTRGCVPTRELAELLPFQSRYANEENVRQVVRRVRSNLVKLGIEGFVESVIGRGYYLAWPLNLVG